MELLEFLYKVQKKIDKPNKWVSYWSESEDGRRLGVDGAIWKLSGGAKELEEKAFKVLAEYSGINPLWDTHHRVTYLITHREVMGMFNRAILSLEEVPE